MKLRQRNERKACEMTSKARIGSNFTPLVLLCWLCPLPFTLACCFCGVAMGRCARFPLDPLVPFTWCTGAIPSVFFSYLFRDGFVRVSTRASLAAGDCSRKGGEFLARDSDFSLPRMCLLPPSGVQGAPAAAICVSELSSLDICTACAAWWFLVV
ncbi:unnamed protein product, partial [Ectocarpus sp. 12 AP-2014]